MSWARGLERLKPQPASLSSKVLWITVATIFCIELLVLIPVLGRQRMVWMNDNLQHRAEIAAYALQTAPPSAQGEILRLAGIQRLNLISPRGQTQSWQVPGFTPNATPVTIPSRERVFHSSWKTCLNIAGFAPSEETFLFSSATSSNAMILVDADTSPLTARLRLYARRGVSFIVIVSLLSGLLVYAALNRLLVRPMEIMTASIIHFRESPEDADSTGLNWLTNRPKDDISTAARELKAMQEELRAALWRNARLAAVGTEVAKIAHDLRNILSSALLMADRLQDIDDPTVRRATRTLIPSVERATQLVSRTVEFAREGPPQIMRAPVSIHELIEEASESLAPESSGWRLENLVPADLVLPMDRALLYRVFLNLIRNAAEAGATLIGLSTETQNGQTRLRMVDNGPGLPERARANLFRPFTGSARSGGTGLGLTIARDLIRAHGGDLVLERTGPNGTVFCMDLATGES
ncbi:sensor histidine kinase [Acidocella sp.]|uniref:sensor histidine kinase n=1 Tax=Acidocella sp. TaxID=50710 RepID=UPI003D00404A